MKFTGIGWRTQSRTNGSGANPAYPHGIPLVPSKQTSRRKVPFTEQLSVQTGNPHCDGEWASACSGSKLMHDARYLISYYRAPIVSLRQAGDSTQGQHSEKERSMANVLTTGAWLSAPTRRPSFFTRLLRAQIEARQRHADRVVQRYLSVHGNEFKDDTEPQNGRLLFFKAGRQR